MYIKLISENERELWDKYVYSHPDSIAWHSYGWSTIIRNHFSIEFFPLAAFDNNKICGVLPLYKLKNGKLISVPYAVAGGMLTNNKAVQKLLLTKAIEYFTQFNSTQITFKQYKIPIEDELRVDKSYYNRELDLTKTKEDLLLGFSVINQQEIRKTENDKLELIYPSKDIHSFYEILLKHQHRNGIPCVSFEWISDLISYDWYSIAFLKDNSTIKAATLVKKFKKTASFPFSCNPGKSKQDNKYMVRLYWEIIKNLKSDGFEIFHSGRIPETEKTDIYRLGWGGEKYQYYYQYYPAETENTESTVKRNWKRTLFKTVWKIIPLNFTRKWGPKITTKFP